MINRPAARALLLLPCLSLAACGGGDSNKKKSYGAPAGASPQQALGQDAQAKADARNLQNALEACFTDSQDYSACKGDQLAGLVPDLTIGSGKGQVDVTQAAAANYTVTAVSRSGNRFEISKGASGAATRKCEVVVEGAGCKGGTW